MDRDHKSTQPAIAPHYHWVRQEFIRLRDKVETAIARPSRAVGREIVDGQTALKNWEQGLRRSARRLPCRFRAFSATILARSRRPSYVETQRALIALEQEVNRLRALYHQLWQQPFPQEFQEGQLLLSTALEKIAADLQDLFSFFIGIVEASACGLPTDGGTYVWQKEISCRAEMAQYKSWSAQSCQSSLLAKGLLALPRLFQAFMAGEGSRATVLPEIMT